MPKHMSRTLAAEIADRTLEITNPANRVLALNATLRRHGFDPAAGTQPDHPIDRPTLIRWLQDTFAQKG